MADITYLPTNDKFVYLSLVTDAYSRKIVGWHVHDSLQTESVAQVAPRHSALGASLGSGHPVLFQLLPGHSPATRPIAFDDRWL